MFYRVLATISLALLTISSAVAQSEAEGFHRVVQIGRGSVLNAQWHPTQRLILINTLRGTWLYTPSDRGFLDDVRQLDNVRLGSFSPNAQYIVGVDPANQLILLDSDAYTELAVFTGHTSYVTALAWSPDGNHLASLDRTGVLFVWNVTGQTPLFQSSTGAVDRIAWSRDGSYLAMLDERNGAVSVWGVSGDITYTLDGSGYPSIYGTGILWRDDHQLLRWIGEENAVVEIWDATTGERTSQRSGGAALNMAYSPDGTKLAIASYGSHVLDAETGDTLFILSPEQRRSSAVAWSPDGRQVAFGTFVNSSTESSSVLVFDVETGEVTRELKVSSYSVKSLYWSADGNILLVVDDADVLQTYGLTSDFPYQSASIAHTEIGTTATWSNDASMIVAADTNYGSRAWDAETGTLLVSRMNIGHAATQIAWQPGGMLVAARSGDIWNSTDNNVYIRDLQRIQKEMEIVSVIPNANIVADMAWSPDGTTLAVIERSRFIRLWSPATPTIIRVIDTWTIRLAPYIDHSQLFTEIDWSPDSTLLSYAYSSSGNGGGVGLLDVAQEKLLVGGSPNFASDWMWTPDNRLIWANWGNYGCGGAPSTVLDIKTGVWYDDSTNARDVTCELPLTGLAEQVVNGIYSPNGQLLIGFDKTNHAIIWNVSSHQALAAFRDVNDAVWSPDSSLLILFSIDRVLYVVDPLTGQRIHTFDDHVDTARDWSRGNVQVIWSPDGRKIMMLDRGTLSVYERYPGE